MTGRSPSGCSSASREGKDIAGSSRLLARFPFAADFVTISTDNRRVLATGTKAASLWEITADDAWPPPIALPAAIGAGGFSADGHWLISGRHDGGPRNVWAIELDVLLPLACRTAGRNLTSTEWDHYFRGPPHRKTCPEYP